MAAPNGLLGVGSALLETTDMTAPPLTWRVKVHLVTDAGASCRKENTHKGNTDYHGHAGKKPVLSGGRHRSMLRTPPPRSAAMLTSQGACPPNAAAEQVQAQFSQGTSMVHVSGQPMYPVRHSILRRG